MTIKDRRLCITAEDITLAMKASDRWPGAFTIAQVRKRRHVLARRVAA
jgi:hypothetical protein